MKEDVKARGLLVFDLDGTLLDTLDDLTASVNQALAAHGLPLRSREEVRGFVGNGVVMLVKRALPPGADEELRQAVFSAFTEHYRVHCADRTRPYPGVTGLLEAARRLGYAAAVVSNKPDREAKALCRRFFPGLLAAVTGARPDLPRKPSPELPRLILAELDFQPAQAVYIGDSPVDIATAAAAGLDCICVSWGFCSREQLSARGARRIADSPQQLLRLLEQARD